MTSKEIIDDLIEREGGFVDHPSDRGGPTHMGITRKTLRAWRGKPVTVDDLRSMRKREAFYLYKQRYFYDTKINDLPIYVRACVLDDAVLSGPVTAIKMLQRNLDHTAVDGIIGPQTIGVAWRTPPKPLIVGITKGRVERYCRIVQRDHTQAVFLVGWVRRAMRFL